MAFVKAAAAGEIPDGTAKQISVGGKTIALFHTEGKYFAIEGICTHRNAPLVEGFCESAAVECPWHGARFDLITGAALCGPAKRGVKAFPVQIVGEEIQVEI